MGKNGVKNKTLEFKKQAEAKPACRPSGRVKAEGNGYIWCGARSMYISNDVCIAYQTRSATECFGCHFYKGDAA